jgi:hypothetical protein
VSDAEYLDAIFSFIEIFPAGRYAPPVKLWQSRSAVRMAIPGGFSAALSSIYRVWGN